MQKKIFFSNSRHFVKKFFFNLSKGHTIAASIIIKNPSVFYFSDHQEGWNNARQDTLFFLDPPL